MLAIPVALVQDNFDPFEYTQERLYLWKDGNVHWVEVYMKYNHWESVQDQPTARLCRFVASEISWSQEHGLEMTIDSNHMYIDIGLDLQFDPDTPFDQQNLMVAGEVTRELWFTALRIIGWTINRID